MSSRYHRQIGIRGASATAVLIILILAGISSLSMAGEFQRSFKFEGEELELTNLVGEINVLPASGTQFLVEVFVRGADADETLMKFPSSEGSTSSLKVEFPLDEYDRYVYPPMGRGSSTSIQFSEENSQDKSWLRKLFSGFSGKKVKVEGRGRGLEMWADITIRVPEGSVLVLANGVGSISAEDCVADLDLDINSGSIMGKSIVGSFKADTGSGRVHVENITGNTNIDTGSGSVTVVEFKGDDLLIDTGSGGVSVKHIICRNLDIDTGSGRVEARQVETDQARIDTGSGSVILQLNRMGKGKFDVDTGSGSVQLILPENASASIIADTGSGGVDVKLTGALIQTRDRDRVELVVGDGEATVKLDTGSGSIVISR